MASQTKQADQVADKVAARAAPQVQRALDPSQAAAATDAISEVVRRLMGLVFGVGREIDPGENRQASAGHMTRTIPKE